MTTLSGPPTVKGDKRGRSLFRLLGERPSGVLRKFLAYKNFERYIHGVLTQNHTCSLRSVAKSMFIAPLEQDIALEPH
jgi:hypothetical protein